MSFADIVANHENIKNWCARLRQGDNMKFGLHFGSRGVAGEPDSLKAIAQKAEVLGYEHFGMSDHVIVATEVDSAYPYSETGKFFAQDNLYQ